MTGQATTTPTDPLWDELIMDALASDGPIRDRDVKDAVARWRPKIEATHESMSEAVLDRIERAIQEQIDDPITRAHFPEAIQVYRNALGIVRVVRGEVRDDRT